MSMFLSVVKYRIYWNKWITIDAWIEIIKQQYNIHEGLDISTTSLTRALSRSPSLRGCDQLKAPNPKGIYQSKRQLKGNRKNKRVVAYYVTLPYSLLKEMPGGNTKWHDSIVSTNPNPKMTTRQTKKRDVPEGCVADEASNQKRARGSHSVTHTSRRGQVGESESTTLDIAGACSKE